MTDDRFERLQRLAEQYAIERDAFEAKDRKINELHARIAELEIIAQYAGEDNAMAEQYAARIAELEAALKEVHRRTGLLMTQNQGRWNMSLEHDRRTADVLSVNQDISSAALEKKND